jgi:hypothetical protein
MSNLQGFKNQLLNTPVLAGDTNQQGWCIVPMSPREGSAEASPYHIARGRARLQPSHRPGSAQKLLCAPMEFYGRNILPKSASFVYVL